MKAHAAACPLVGFYLFRCGTRTTLLTHQTRPFHIHDTSNQPNQRNRSFPEGDS